MLASGAHVKIGAYEYVLDLEAGDPYLHEYTPLFPSSGGEIIGTDGKRVTRPDLIYWTMDDWSGGAGYKYYDPRDPTTYHYGTCNTRIPGEVTNTPITASTETGLSTASEADKPVFFAQSDNKLWIAYSRQIAYSTDGVTWTAHASEPLGAAGYEVTAMCTDGRYVYVAMHDDPTTTGTRKVLQITSSAVTTMVSDKTTTAAFYGMAVMDGKLYGWTGRKLIAYSTTATFPITHDTSHEKYNVGDDVVPSGIIAKMTRGGKSLFFLSSTPGGSQIWEWRKDTPTPIWEMPIGFTARDLCVSNDTLYVVGDNGVGKGVLYGMSLASRVPLYLADLDFDNTTASPVAVAGSYGHQILIGMGGAVDSMATVYMYVYDSEYDAVSYLASHTTLGQTYPAVVTFRGKRIAGATSSTSINLRQVNHDDDPLTSGTWELFSSEWDMGFPFSDKILHGIHVTMDSLGASDQAIFYFGKDGAAAGTTTIGTIDVDGTTHQYLPVTTTSSTVTFKRIHFKVLGTGDMKIKSITVKAQLAEYTESWKLKLRLKDEASPLTGRKRTTKAAASALRDNLRTLVTNKAVVTFLDGYRYDQPGRYSTHDVTIEFPSDRIGVNSTEGTAEVILRAVTNV